MAYIFKQKLNIYDLAGFSENPKRVLIHEPEEYLGALYAHYLKAHNFDVKHCPDLAKIREAINNFNPDVFVFSLDAMLTPQPIRKLLTILTVDFPNLRLVSTSSGNHQQHVRELMDHGVLGHINRKLSRPQDLAVIVRSVL